MTPGVPTGFFTTETLHEMPEVVRCQLRSRLYLYPARKRRFKRACRACGNRLHAVSGKKITTRKDCRVKAGRAKPGCAETCRDKAGCAKSGCAETCCDKADCAKSGGSRRSRPGRRA